MRTIVLCCLLASTLRAQASPPAPDTPWRGVHLFRGERYAACLHRIPSSPGVRDNGIDRTLALTVHPARPDGSLLLLAGGGRDVKASRSFGDAIAIGDLDLGRFLSAGYVIAFLEYRGSKTPGSPATFDPPLPRYDDLIAGYEDDAACEYGLGDAYDVVAAARYLMSGEPFRVAPGRVFAAGGSHGGYLVLRLARDLDGIAGIACGHPPTDLRGSLAHLRAPPGPKHPHFGQSPAVPATAARVAFESLARRLRGREQEPGTSLLHAPPRCARILLWHGIDDWLVTVANARWYAARWQAERPGLVYAEFAARDVPRLFPRSAGELAAHRLLATHSEQITGSALEPAIARVLGLEQGPVELPVAVRGIQRVDARVRVQARDPRIDLRGARVVRHDLPCWCPLPAQEGVVGQDGVAVLHAVPAGWQLLDVTTRDGTRAWADCWAYLEAEAEAGLRL